jgi:hypothetical protein
MQEWAGGALAFWQSEKLSKFLLAGRGRYKKIDRVPGLNTMLAARDVGRAQEVAEMGVNQHSISHVMSQRERSIKALLNPS